MSMQDPVSDLFTRIRNGYFGKKKYISVYFSSFKLSIIKLLIDENFIDKYEVVSETPSKKIINVYLKYFGKKNIPMLKNIKRISRPGLRVYKKHNELSSILNGFGVVLVSTSVGILTNKEAKKKKHGGEVICIVE